MNSPWLPSRLSLTQLVLYPFHTGVSHFNFCIITSQSHIRSLLIICILYISSSQSVPISGGIIQIIYCTYKSSIGTKREQKATKPLSKISSSASVITYMIVFSCEREGGSELWKRWIFPSFLLRLVPGLCDGPLHLVVSVLIHLLHQSHETCPRVFVLFHLWWFLWPM